MDNELRKIDVWLTANKLTFNIKKTHCMMYKNKHIDQQMVYIQGKEIAYTKSSWRHNR